MPQIIEMLSLIRPELFTFDRSIDGPFCFYAPVDGHLPNTVFPLIDRRRANAEVIGRSVPAAENFDDTAESFVRSHGRESKALLANNQALLRIGAEKQTSGMEKAPDLAERISKAQDQAGISDADIARACKVSPQAVYEWKRTGRIHKKQLPKLAALFGKSLDWFLGDSDEDEDGLEQEMLGAFRSLTRERQQIAIAQIKSLSPPVTLHEPASTYTAKRKKVAPAKKPWRADGKALKLA